jgi:nucleotide-binding universal stress UspA family protein
VSGTIVVGVDGSNCSDAAVEKALELAAGLGDTLVVVYAVEPPVQCRTPVDLIRRK